MATYRETGTATVCAKRAAESHFLPLDGFRGFAVLLVIFHHIGLFAAYLKPTTSSAAFIWLGQGGWVGVDAFFVLSGFLITGILVRSLKDPHYFRNFYIRRTLRIFPLYYFVILSLIAISFGLHFKWNNGYLAYLLYFQNLAQTLDPRVWRIAFFNLGHFWSLAVEEQYYLVWPLAVWLVKDRLKLMRACLVLIGVGFLLRLSILLALSPTENMQWEWTYRELPTHADGLLIGSWLALCVMRESPQMLLRRFRYVWIAALATVIAIVAFTRTLLFHDYAMQIFGFAAIPIVFGGILLRALQPGLIARFFSAPPLRFLGKYSYGLYVYHYLIFTIMSQLLRPFVAATHSSLLGFLLCVAIWMVVSLVVAVLSYDLFESRFLALKDKLSPRSIV